MVGEEEELTQEREVDRSDLSEFPSIELIQHGSRDAKSGTGSTINHGVEGPASRESLFAHEANSWETDAQEKIGQQFSSDFETLQEDEVEIEVYLCADGAADTRVTGYLSTALTSEILRNLCTTTVYKRITRKSWIFPSYMERSHQAMSLNWKQLFKRIRSMLNSRRSTDHVFELERCQQGLDRDGC